jgi:hypothetical protein
MIDGLLLRLPKGYAVAEVTALLEKAGGLARPLHAFLLQETQVRARWSRSPRSARPPLLLPPPFRPGAPPPTPPPPPKVQRAPTTAPRSFAVPAPLLRARAATPTHSQLTQRTQHLQHTPLSLQPPSPPPHNTTKF